MKTSTQFHQTRVCYVSMCCDVDTNNYSKLDVFTHEVALILYHVNPH